MSIFNQAESGTKVYRSRFKLRDRKIWDASFFRLYPALARFTLPGDIWRINADMLIRLQPMLSPSLTSSAARVRFFFVPIRLVEDNTEFIITGSKDGVYTAGETVPSFDNIFKNVDTTISNPYTVVKGSVLDLIFGMPVGDYTSIKNDASIPAMYWIKAYARIWWDYFRDENLYTTYNDFDTFFADWSSDICHREPLPVGLPKDYFTSSLPWQLKGVAPVINVSSSGTVQFSSNVPAVTTPGVQVGAASGGYGLGQWNGSGVVSNNEILNALNNHNSVSISNLGIDAADLRTMMAETRVFERLARTGSRYTEYLRANFNTSPADGTLQRAQYLGGYKQPIVTTEVVQSAGATSSGGSNLPVGTLRGHGISHAIDGMQTYHVKEFGMIFATVDFRPRVQYTQGIPKEYTYKSRFDFFNPSFQHLSEQEVRNGEIYIDFSDGKNDDTFGFQAYANELRTGKEMVVGDMRDSLAYWTQCLKFASRPNLNWALLNGTNHDSSWMQPFAVTSGNPLIVDFGTVADVYRPMVRYGTPGLVDHL